MYLYKFFTNFINYFNYLIIMEVIFNHFFVFFLWEKKEILIDFVLLLVFLFFGCLVMENVLLLNLNFP